MRRDERERLRFVRTLLGGASAEMRGTSFIAGENGARLGRAAVQELAAAGVLDLAGDSCHAANGARTWIKRAMLEQDQYAAQHRETVTTSGGLTVNLAESPLLRLARPGKGEADAFLNPAQVEAGERVRRLAERARLQPRVTMSYSATHTANGGARNGLADLSDLAADARRDLMEITRILPRDCVGVVMDVCGLGKGLQAVEAERNWPRRSAKLVLRIGLDHLARHFGLDDRAVGPERGRHRRWRERGARAVVVE